MNDQEALTFNQNNIVEFRANHGRIASFGLAPLLLLTTTGAKSGQRRTSPMMYLQDDDDSNLVYVFASAAGSDRNPAWFHNVIANRGSADVEIGDDRYRATADVLPEPDRTETYAIQATRNPGFAGYQQKTKRVIPVLALTLTRSDA